LKSILLSVAYFLVEKAILSIFIT